MASTSKGTITLRGAFPAGEKIALYDRTGDFFTAALAGNAVKTSTVTKESEVSFDNLEPGSVYWAAAKVDGEWRARAVTAKEAPPSKPKGKPLQTAAPGEDTSENVTIVTGARSTKDKPKPPPTFGHDSIGQQSDNPEAVPHLSQEDARSTPQRSFTVTGEAHPKPKDEAVPAPKQEDVSKSTQQRSATETGEATVIPKGEQDEAPSVPQEDVKGKQRSDTETGEGTPKPPDKPQKPSVQRAPSGSRTSSRQPASSAEKKTPAKSTTAKAKKK